MSAQEIVGDFPELTDLHIRAALEFAAVRERRHVRACLKLLFDQNLSRQLVAGAALLCVMTGKRDHAAPRPRRRATGLVWYYFYMAADVVVAADAGTLSLSGAARGWIESLPAGTWFRTTAVPGPRHVVRNVLSRLLSDVTPIIGPRRQEHLLAAAASR